MSGVKFGWSVSLGNPMVQAHGNGPDKMRCQQCAFLNNQTLTPNQCTCALRGFSVTAEHGHQVNWPACRRFMKQDD